MTERKPAGLPPASWAEAQISAAIARGEFDDIPGQGKPIEDLDTPYDEVWFRRKLADEGFDEEVLPESLKLRRQLERLQDTLAGLRSERAARHVVDELNARIERHHRMPSGPDVSVTPVDPEQAVAEWRATRTEGAPAPERDTGRHDGQVGSRRGRPRRGRARWGGREPAATADAERGAGRFTRLWRKLVKDSGPGA